MFQVMELEAKLGEAEKELEAGMKYFFFAQQISLILSSMSTFFTFQKSYTPGAKG